MGINSSLAADLALLNDAVSEPDVDIVQVLSFLASDARTAVDSFAGLSLTLVDGGLPMIFTVLESAGDGHVVSSLLLPMSKLAPGDIGISVVLYGGRPGAFVDLAADLAWLTGQDLAEFRLDQHLVVPDGNDSLRTLREASVVNQALGMLVGRGFLPDDAVRELDARAESTGTSRYVIAERLLPPGRDDGDRVH